MIKVNSKIKLNMAKMRQLTSAQATALEQTAEALHTEIVQAQVVPRDKGTLQGEAFAPDYSQSRSGKVTLVHSEPYARRLYFHPEYHFQKGENPNAKGEWFEDWMPGGKNADFAINAYKKLYRRLGGL